jgi:hypothetical protein
VYGKYSGGNNMKKLTPAFLIVALAFQAYAAKPGGGGGGDRCTDIPISWTFENSTTTGIPSAITGDGKRPDYREGVDGVFNSKIHRIYGQSCDGTRDATLGLSKSKRTVSVSFSGIDGTDTVQGQFPDFNGTTLAIQPFFNIANIMGYGHSVGSTYYTKMGFGFNAPGDRKTSYQVWFFPFDWQCPEGFDCITRDQPTANLNDPVAAAWVRINYIPASGTTPDQWIAEGEFSDPEIQRGTLLANSIHRGQFSMPFRIRITALAPLQ